MSATPLTAANSYRSTDAATEAMDADGHIMEPATMWLDHIDPAARDLAICVHRDPADGDKLIVDGRVRTVPRRLGGVRANGSGPVPDWNTLPSRDHYVSYMESVLTPSYDPRARLDWMDQQGIDTTILFPSLGLIWPRLCAGQMTLINANVDAYNRWIEGFVSADGRRLLPVAQTVALPECAQSGTNLDKLASRGFRAVMLPITDPADGSPYTQRFDSFWSAVAANEMVVCLHKAAMPTLLCLTPGTRIGIDGTQSLFNHVHETIAGQLNLVAILDSRMPDRFPGLRFAFLECGAGWVPPVLDRAMESWDVVRRRNDIVLAQPPWEYVLGTDRFFFNVAPSEDLGRMGVIVDKLVVASDYPHPDHPENCLAEWRKLVSPLTAVQQRQVLGSNARRMLRSLSLSGAGAQ